MNNLFNKQSCLYELYINCTFLNFLTLGCSKPTRKQACRNFFQLPAKLSLGKKEKWWGTLQVIAYDKFSLRTHKKLLRGHRSWLQSLPLLSDPTVQRGIVSYLQTFYVVIFYWCQFDIFTKIETLCEQSDWPTADIITYSAGMEKLMGHSFCMWNFMPLLLVIGWGE